RSVAVVPNTFDSSDVVKDVSKRVFLFYTLSKTEKDRFLVVGTKMFHYGIVAPLPITAQVHDTIGLYVGCAAGLVTLAGRLVLIGRRVAVSRMRQISAFEDYFVASLLLAIIVFGLLQTLVVKPDYL